MASLEVLRCPNCGATAKANADCPYCGVALVFARSAATTTTNATPELVISALKCTRCGAGNGLDTAHCSQCGTSLRRPCPSCGRKVYLAARHCGGCGAPMPNADSAVPELMRARQMMKTGDLEGAEGVLVAASHTPDNPHVHDALLMLGRLKLEQARKLRGDVRFTALHERKLLEALSHADEVRMNTTRREHVDFAQALRNEAESVLRPPRAKSNAGNLIMMIIGIIGLIFALSHC
jgi:hypothetical protein